MKLFYDRGSAMLCVKEGVLIHEGSQADLLDACKAARRAIADLNGRVARDVWGELFETTEKLDIAIAKARGAQWKTSAFSAGELPPMDRKAGKGKVPAKK